MQSLAVTGGSPLYYYAHASHERLLHIALSSRKARDARLSVTFTMQGFLVMPALDGQAYYSGRGLL